MKHKKTIIISVIVLAISFILIALFNSTYALFSSDDYAKIPESYSTGLLRIETRSKTENISLANALPINDEEGVLTEPYVFTIKNIGNLDYKFDVKLLSVGSENIFLPRYIRLQVDDGDVISLSDLSNSIIKDDIILKVGESIDISIKIWLSIETPNTELGKSFNSKIVTDGQAIYTESNYDINTSLVEYINNLYLDNKNKVVTNNNIEYQYAQSVNLMNDRLGGTTSDYDDGNIRYYGVNPDNYVDIGDRDSSGNVILYRIIGLFKDVELSDGAKQDLIKVIRSNTIGEYSFDNKPSGFGSSDSTYGSNDWTDARLMMLLNPGYDVYNNINPLLDNDGNIIYGYEGSLWWNSKRGTCYSGSSGATKTCDFTKNGLSVSAQSNIETVVWPLGAHNIVGAYSDAFYKSERGTAVFAGRPTKWTGKVSMMYSSDYGYAADLDVCKNSLQTYNNAVCKNSNWLWTGITDLHLTPNRNYSYFSYYNKADAAISEYGASYTPNGVRPVFYLRSSINILSGVGTSSNPYVLG